MPMPPRVMMYSSGSSEELSVEAVERMEILKSVVELFKRI
jgi:hypothetical protein